MGRLGMDSDGAHMSAFCRLGEGAFCKAVYTIMYTGPMAKTVPVRELRSNLSSLLDDVSDRRDHVLVTRNGVPAAALVPIDEYEALEETAEVLSDPDALSALEAGLAEIAREETVTLAELRRELAERRAATG
jgi:antitoxin YefM